MLGGYDFDHSVEFEKKGDACTPFQAEAMTKHRDLTSKFAICINTDDPNLLTPRMIYRVMPDENAARSNYIRVYR